MSRPYDQDRDFDHQCRIWKEVGWWIDGDRGKKYMELYVEACETIVEDVHGEMEVGVSRCPAVMWHQGTSLPVVLIVGVNGSGKNSAVESIAPGETAWREEPQPTPGETKSPAVPP